LIVRAVSGVKPLRDRSPRQVDLMHDRAAPTSSFVLRPRRW
jgi:hypothetical protein